MHKIQNFGGEMYALIVKPEHKTVKCRVIKTETLRFSWKDHHKRGFLLYKLYEDWDDSQIGLRKLKAARKVPAEHLRSIRGCWLDR